MYGMFYSLWPRKYKTYIKPNTKKNLVVNMFITVAGEPIEIVEKTIKGALKAREYYIKKVHPQTHPRVIVLNDGYVAKKDNWKEIRDLCKTLKVDHVARKIPGGFKAGNINNGLTHFPAADPVNTIDCFFDSDFVAEKDFITEITKPLADTSVDFVQSPQRYQNLTTWVSKASAAHQMFFFDYVCPAKAHDNALFLCGTNYAIRRSALESVGGVDTDFITEDYATSIKLHLSGKKGVFVEKVLARGLAPMTLKEYFTQQTRWSKGSFDTNAKFFRKLFFGPLSLKQKMHYFLSATYYLIGVRDLFLILAPIPYLLWGTSLIKGNTLFFLGLIYLPLLVSNLFLFMKLFQYPVMSIVLDLISFPIFTVAFLSSLFKRDLAFVVTLKKYEKENPFKVYRIQLAVLAILIISLSYSFFFTDKHSLGSAINYFWAIFDTALLSIGFFLVIKENYSFSIKTDFGIRRLREMIPIPFETLTRTTSVLMASAIVSISTPIIYDLVTGSSQTVVQATGALAQVFGRQELIAPSEGIYYGYYKPDLNAHPEDVDIRLVPEESPTLAMYYQDWESRADFDTSFMNKIARQGAIPIVTWEPFVAHQPDAALNTPLAPQERITSEEYDTHIRRWAEGAKSYGKPFFLRFAHEMNGNWYPWGDHDGNSSQSYINMWRHVHDIFSEVGAENVIWVWSPNNTNQFGNTDTVLSYYPGDEYVDWVGYSAFNWGSSNQSGFIWRDFESISLEIYTKLSSLNKPIMVAEMSSVPDTQNGKRLWFDQALRRITTFKHIKALVMFDQDFGDVQFSMNSGMDKQKMVRGNILGNEYFLTRPVYGVQ